jgi:hypothetical protein
MGAGVTAIAQVRFDLDDPTGELGSVRQPTHQIRPEELGAYLEAGPLEEPPREASARLHLSP